jgi:hypothetical protein
MQIERGALGGCQHAGEVCRSSAAAMASPWRRRGCEYAEINDETQSGWVVREQQE